jgi:hypothetical protein
MDRGSFGSGRVETNLQGRSADPTSSLNEPESLEVRVDRDEFCRLLVSRRELARVDDHRSGTCGLVDRTTRTTFVIPRRELLTI